MTTGNGQLLDAKLPPERRRRWFAWPLILLATVVLLGGAYTIYRLRLRAHFNSMLDDIRKAGYPATLEELDKWYEAVPDDENAAVVLQIAFSNIVEPTPQQSETLPIIGSAELPAPGVPLTDEMKQAIAEHLTRNERALGLLHQAAGIKKCRYQVDLTLGPATLMPHLKKTREGARLLCLEAILAAEEQNGEKAARAIHDSLGLGRYAASRAGAHFAARAHCGGGDKCGKP